MIPEKRRSLDSKWKNFSGDWYLHPQDRLGGKQTISQEVADDSTLTPEVTSNRLISCDKQTENTADDKKKHGDDCTAMPSSNMKVPILIPSSLYENRRHNSDPDSKTSALISSSSNFLGSFRNSTDVKGRTQKPRVTMEQKIVSNILNKNSDFLSRHLVLSPSVLDRLFSAGIITDVARKQIIFQEQKKQVPLLLQHLEGHGLVTIRKFLEVLKETGHSWLVDTILDTEAISYEDVTPKNTGREPEISSPDRHPRLLTPDWYTKSFTKPLSEHKPQPAPFGQVSLAKLLEQRQRLMEDYKPIRGQLQPKVILEDVLKKPARFSKATTSSTFDEDVPSSLLNLQGYFKSQSVTNEQTLSVLKQEEIAIRELLEQNIRDQAKLRKNQLALGDIAQRLEEIHVKATDVYNPATDAQLSRYRLAQLNQIPWREEN